MAEKKMIDSLTPEQEARFPEFVDKWTEIYMSTEPCDFEKAKEAAKLAYKLAGLAEPTQFYLADSPIHAIKIIQELYPSLSARDIFNNMSYGNHEATWLSFYDYFREVCGLEFCAKLEGLNQIARYSGWVSFYEDVVVFQHRPNVIKLDDQKRLHCEDGPAVSFPDGYSVYSWHGTRIPKEWIENKSALTPEIALTWENIEQRRCACEILGWATILRKLDARVIDSDPDPMIGNLLEVELPELGTERFLQVLCGTGRTFAIPVPPNMKTALEANAWSYDIPSDLLKGLEVRT